MPGSTPSALEPIQHQLRRVRRRWNTRALVRALLASIATSGGAAALLVVAALSSSPPRFLGIAMLLGVAQLAAAAAIVVATCRGWLRTRTAHHGVDRHGRLGGRLATLIDLGRPPAAEGSALRALLAAQNVAMLPLWRRERLVPRLAPAGMRAAALGGVGALVVALVLGPVLVHPPEPAPIAPDAATTPRRSLRRAPLTLTRGDAVGVPDDMDGGGNDDGSVLARMAEAAQHGLHRALWGEEAALRAQALARAQAAETPTERPDAHNGGDVADGGETVGRVEPGGEMPERDGASLDVARGAGRPEADDATVPGGERRVTATADGAARGAGSSTSPDLYGRPSPGGVHQGTAPFALGLTADVRAVGGGPRPPSGETPLQAPDAHPPLAAERREAVAVPRTPVPSDYAVVVRRLFERTP